MLLSSARWYWRWEQIHWTSYRKQKELNENTNNFLLSVLIFLKTSFLSFFIVIFPTLLILQSQRISFESVRVNIASVTLTWQKSLKDLEFFHLSLFYCSFEKMAGYHFTPFCWSLLCSYQIKYSIFNNSFYWASHLLSIPVMHFTIFF